MNELIHNIEAVDWSILYLINSTFSCELLDGAMGFLTYFFGYIIWPALAVVLIIRKSTRFDGIFLGAAILLSVLIVQFLLKSLIPRDRPYMSLPPDEYFFVADVGSSFPSSHTSLVFAASAYCCKISKKLIIPAYLVSVIVAFSRLYLFAHFPSDVLGGALIGTTLGIVMIIVSKRVYMRLDSSKPQKENR